MQAAALDRLFTWSEALCRDAEQLAGDAAAAAAAASDGPSLDARRPGGGGGGLAPASPYRMLQRALNVLQEQRLPYFRSCQETLVASRRTACARRFLRALSSGSVGAGSDSSGSAGGGASRPIDLQAHDPLRYAGDMLAWVHTAVVEERELLAGLYGGPLAAHDSARKEADERGEAARAASPAAGEGGSSSDDGAAAPAAPPGSPPPAPPLSLRDMLTGVIEGVSRPLCVRLEQVIGTQTSLVTTLKLLDITAYYAATLWTLLTPGTGLLDALSSHVHAAAVARFNALLAAHSARTRAAPPAFPSDLSPCALVVDTAAQLGEVLRVYAASLATAAEDKLAASSPPAPGGGPGAVSALIEIDRVLDGVLEPLVETCRAGAEGLRISDTAVYMLNNLSSLQAALSPYAFTSAWVQRLASEIAAWEEALVQQSANDLLAGCGLLAKLTAMRSHDPAASGGLPLAALPTLGPHDLRAVVSAFYAELSSPSLISLFDRVGNPRIRSRVRRDTAAVLAAAYARLYADVTAPASGYAAACDVHTLLQQTPEQVEVLLDLR